MGKGYNKSLFGGVPKKNVNKSRFNLSHEWKNQFNPGLLIPCMVLETLPNDEFEIDSEFMFRFSPLYFPIMHKLTMRADYFYIPNRILWPYQSEANKGWTRWINNDETYTHPTIDINQAWDQDVLSQSIGNYFGLPTILDSVAGTDFIITGLNAFPFSAYLLIWDNYFRIPQIEEERWFPLAAGDNTTAFGVAFSAPITSTKYYEVFSSKWEKDYFTSALPSPQVNDAITIPTLDENLPITQTVRVSATGVATNSTDPISGDGTGILIENGASTQVYIDQDNPATIKQLRIAEVLQSYYERIMKVGTRYRDFIEGLWGVDPEPNTIDLPVQFGSKFGRVQVSDVMTQASYDYAETGTSRTGDYTGQANMYSNDGGKLHYRCYEHGWIMCILQVNPNTSYGQGIERFWRRSVQTDYPLDMFSSIGDQEILREEVLYNPITANAALNETTFGYIPRFSEMRYKNNIFGGGLAQTIGLSEHLGRVWSVDVYVAGDYQEFIEIDSDFTDVSPRGSTLFSEDEIGGIRLDDVFRILPDVSGTQIESEATIKAHVYHSVYVNRQLPMFSVPDLT